MNISIVIPTVKNLEGLKALVESIKTVVVLNNIETIIVANGSTEETKKYVDSLIRPFRLLWFDKALGAPEAYNEGIKRCDGEFILLLNDDVVMLSDEWLELLTKPLESPDVGLTGPLKFTIIDSTKEAFAFWCVMIKRKVFEKIGYLDNIFYPFGFEDVDFCIRASRAGYKLVQVPENVSNKFLEEGPKGKPFPIYHKGSTTVDAFMEYNYVNKGILENRNMKIIIDRYGD